MSALTRLREVPTVAWVGAALAAGLAVLVVHRYATDPEDTSWLNPQQPGINLDLVKGAALQVGQDATPAPTCRPRAGYPGTLHGWDGTWIGDC